MASPVAALKTLLVGRPKETAHLEHERLSKTIGLAVFASDNLSSAAYATQEMLGVLVLGGAAALNYSIPVSIALVAVVAIIAFSYQETIRAYPSGGGAYIVAHDNLGKYPGLIAAAALLIDYVLTVSVSVAAGVDSVVSFAPGLHAHKVAFALGVIWLITMMNLRGVRESGTIFAVPTYAFLILVGATIVVGLVKYFIGGGPTELASAPPTVQHVSLFLLLTAFARGSAAVTGIEAISNGVPAFREPAARNAARTLVIMASLLAFLFLGISVLSHLYHVWEPTKTRTLVGLIAERVFGEGPIFVAVLGATALILFLAANTSYADFPRLSSVLARDRYFPRQFMNRGDRLAFSNGIIGLAVFASLLIIVFDASVTRLINLYVMGVFTALTLSQTGMVVHWRREKQNDRRWLRNAIINGVGAVVTLLVLVIVLLTRFTHGGWMVAIAVCVLVFFMGRINHHYANVARVLRLPERRPRPGVTNHVMLLVGTPSEEEARAFWYADRIRTEDFHAVHFTERGDPKGLEAQWSRLIGLLPTSPSLETEPSRGSLSSSVRSHVDRFRQRLPEDDFVTVIVSERVRQGAVFTFGTRTGLLLKFALLYTPGVVVTDVPFLEGATGVPLGPRGGQNRHVVVVLVPAAHNATMHALQYAKTLSSDEVHAVHVVLDPEFSERHLQEWQQLDTGLPLELVESPYRWLGQPVRDYVRGFTKDGNTIVTVILAEFVVQKWWQRVLHNNNAFDVKWIFLTEPDVIVTSVPYHLEMPRRDTPPERRAPRPSRAP